MVPLLAAARRFVVLLGVFAAGCSSGPPLELAKSVDLNRYSGKWYVIAEIPYFGERGDVGNTVVYTPLPDGHIRDEYFAHAKTFDAPEKHMTLEDTVVDGTGNALWRVKLFWPIFVSYPILSVEDDYGVALVGYPDRSLGWIFSRKPDMSDADYRRNLAVFERQGYKISDFRRVAQHPEQIGQAGFE